MGVATFNFESQGWNVGNNCEEAHQRCWKSIPCVAFELAQRGTSRDRNSGAARQFPTASVTSNQISFLVYSVLCTRYSVLQEHWSRQRYPQRGTISPEVGRRKNFSFVCNSDRLPCTLTISKATKDSTDQSPGRHPPIFARVEDQLQKHPPQREPACLCHFNH